MNIAVELLHEICRLWDFLGFSTHQKISLSKTNIDQLVEYLVKEGVSVNSETINKNDNEVSFEKTISIDGYIIQLIEK